MYLAGRESTCDGSRRSCRIREMQEPFFEPVKAQESSGVFSQNMRGYHQSKVIRSTMGSIYRMPFLYVKDVVSLERS